MAGDRAGVWRVLRNTNFVRLWLGQMISFIGDYFYFLAIPITVNRLTGSTLMVGLSTIFNAVPLLLLGPVAGVFVDRWDRKRTMIVADVLRGLLVLLCLLVQTSQMVWLFYVVGFLMSCASRFFFPSRSAVMPLIVRDKDDLLAANALMQTTEMAALLAGPALAGFAIGLWGPAVAFIADSASFFISAGVIFTMYLAPRAVERPAEGRQVATVWTELREGLAYLFSNRTMVGVLICLAVVQLGVGAINVVWVPYLQRTFGVGAEGLGLVDALQGAGMVVGGLALGLLAARLRNSAIIGACLAIIGVAIAAMGLVPAFGYLLALSFCLGLALTPAESALITLMQLAVPDRKMGRVNSAMNALVTLATLLSMATAATLGDLIGLRTIYIICGLLAAVAGLLALRIPEPTAVLAPAASNPLAAAEPGPADEPNRPAVAGYQAVPATLDDGGGS
jgi:DHA3 family macrolide efflux protein-like MFS transporter